MAVGICVRSIAQAFVRSDTDVRDCSGTVGLLVYVKGKVEVKTPGHSSSSTPHLACYVFIGFSQKHCHDRTGFSLSEGKLKCYTMQCHPKQLYVPNFIGTEWESTTY